MFAATLFAVVVSWLLPVAVYAYSVSACCVPSYIRSHMCAALALSRACATVWEPGPEPTFIQKLTELSGRGVGSPFARAWNCCAALESSRPNAPACAAEPMTVADPFPSRPSQALVLPDSKPSEKTTLV